MEFVMSDVVLNDKKDDKPTPKHKGLYYRGRVSYYYSESSGEFHKKVGLKPLKRKSCKGCPTCDAIHESISEGDMLEEIIDGVKDGKMYRIDIDGGREWTDYGWEYDSWIDIKVVENE